MFRSKKELTIKFKKFIKDSIRSLGVDLSKVVGSSWMADLKIKTVLDIGAHEGQFALETEKNLPSAVIYSFEPLSDVYTRLVGQDHSGVRKFKAFNIALGDFNGKAKINRNKFSPSSSLLDMSEKHREAFPFTADTLKEAIEVRRLDDFVKEKGLTLHPEILIKVDVQGFEDRVISGGIETFKKAKAVITEVSYIELYEGQPSFDALYKIFEELGFTYRGPVYTKFHPTSGLPVFSDALFVNEE